MNNAGYGNVNSSNPLLQYLQGYISTQQQTELPQQYSEPQRNSQTISTFEINSQDDIKYVEPDKSGRLQMVYCRNEKRVFVGRYNFLRQEMEWESFISEGEISLSKNQNSEADMSKVAEALVAVANKLEVMQSDIQSIKEKEPVTEVSNRRSNGQFKKKGE